MSISSIGQSPSFVSLQKDKNMEISPATKEKNAENTTIPAKKVDFRNISPNEISELIESGVEELSGIVPFIPFDIIEKYGSEYAANFKIDFLGQIESSIEFNKSIGEDTVLLEKALTEIMNIIGSDFPSKIDATA